jgi:hypothetical protein
MMSSHRIDRQTDKQTNRDKDVGTVDTPGQASSISESSRAAVQLNGDRHATRALFVCLLVGVRYSSTVHRTSGNR